MLVGQLRIYAEAEALYAAAAQRWVELAARAIAARGKFHVALSGGRTPRALYELLATAPYAGRIAWEKVHIYFGDERCVPPDHADSNYRLAREALLDHVPVPPPQVHRIEGERMDAGEAATKYAQTLAQRVSMSAQGVVQLDLVLLGVGEDGHIASLFPGTPILRERARLADAVYAEDLDSWRISITLPVIDHARHVMLLVLGQAKAPVMRTVFTNGRTPPYPVQLINPRGTMEWYLDTAAAAQLPPELRA